eukprot:CAMPEP_0115103240 /NCGR_PEP_ID=MMETSP0227-20121206/34457_1 /TAXON_ID=89957 /ORGANISM="Polarella glacialis, Strain CCMP 1383" /LENGTH=172 /DNA_ID=CAMNT_0002499639 /DNA_START=163 /DNA_END=679 /DNA_ORIENTATION=-
MALRRLLAKVKRLSREELELTSSASPLLRQALPASAAAHVRHNEMKGGWKPLPCTSAAEKLAGASLGLVLLLNRSRKLCRMVLLRLLMAGPVLVQLEMLVELGLLVVLVVEVAVDLEGPRALAGVNQAQDSQANEDAKECHRFEVESPLGGVLLLHSLWMWLKCELEPMHLE